MNKAAKVVIAIYLTLLALICIYVPWRTNIAIAQGTILVDSIGYAPIWALHTFQDAYQGATVDVTKIVLEIIALTAIFAIPFMFAYKGEEYEYINPEDFAINPERESEDEISQEE